MKQSRPVLIAALLLCTVACARSQHDSRENLSVLGTFVASTPCSQGTKPLPGIPANADCQLMKWKLVLYQHKDKQTPATYQLHCWYGLPRQGTTGLSRGGTTIDLAGKWTVLKGTASKPHATIYQLHDSKTNRTISFLRLSNDLLHLLDSDLHLMTGSAAWSYTFNKTGNK